MTERSENAASFFDGLTTKPHRVEISEHSEGLTFTNTQTGEMTFWRWRDLRLAQNRQGGAVLVVTNAKQPDARLGFETELLRDMVARNVPKLARPKGLMSSKFTWGVLVGFFTVVAGAVLVFTVPPLTVAAGRLVPDPWMRSIGEYFVNDFAGGADWCVAPDSMVVLDKIVADLSAAAGALPFELSVGVLDYASANAFAAPGGHVVVLSGLIDEAKSGDEVAGVLAHEIAHVIHRHPMESLVRAMGLAVLAEALGGDGLGGAAAMLLAVTAYSREAEAEADATAVALLQGAGYDPLGLTDFFGRMAREEKRPGAGLIPSYLSTHPPSEARVRMIENLAPGDRGQTGKLPPRTFKVLQGICERTF